MRAAIFIRLYSMTQKEYDWDLLRVLFYAYLNEYKIHAIIYDDAFSDDENKISCEKLLKLAQEGKVDTILCCGVGHLCSDDEVCTEFMRGLRESRVLLKKLFCDDSTKIYEMLLVSLLTLLDMLQEKCGKPFWEIIHP